MPQFQLMENSTLIICEVQFELFFDEVYEVLVNFILKSHTNSCVGNINLSDDVRVMI